MARLSARARSAVRVCFGACRAQPVVREWDVLKPCQGSHDRAGNEAAALAGGSQDGALSAETGYVDIQERARASRMSARPPTRKAQRTKPMEDQRAAPGGNDKRGSLGWVRNVLGRSIGLEQRR